MTDLLQKSAQHHQKANCEQLAAAIYLDAAEKLAESSAAPYYDQAIEEPKIRENSQIQLRSFIEKAANLRNDETSGNFTSSLESIHDDKHNYSSTNPCDTLSTTIHISVFGNLLLRYFVPI